MTSLTDIPIKIADNIWETGNLQSILYEIRHALHELATANQEHSIDLRSMPFAPGEEEKLDKLLAKGEVSVEIDAVGKSIIYETAISSVWMVSHYNSNDELVAKLIEITAIPRLICSPRQELQDSITKMGRLLELNNQ